MRSILVVLSAPSDGRQEQLRGLSPEQIDLWRQSSSMDHAGGWGPGEQLRVKPRIFGELQEKVGQKEN